MITLIVADERSATDDVSRAMAQIVRASTGGFELRSGSREYAESMEAAGKAILVDGLLIDGQALPRLVSGFRKPGIYQLEPALDPRLRCQKPEARVEKVLRVISCSEIGERRGFEEALAFFDYLESSGIAFHWYILGAPTDEAYFDRLTESLEAREFGDSVTFVGDYSLEKMIHLAMNMDLAYFPSKQDPMGICALECAQLGLPMLFDFPQGARDEAFASFLARLAGADETIRVKRDFSSLSSWREQAERLEEKFRG